MGKRPRGKVHDPRVITVVVNTATGRSGSYCKPKAKRIRLPSPSSSRVDESSLAGPSNTARDDPPPVDADDFVMQVQIEPSDVRRRQYASATSVGFIFIIVQCPDSVMPSI